MKAALVTGASSGLGASLAIALAHWGFVVIVHYRNNEKDAQQPYATIRAQGHTAYCFQADLSREAPALALAEFVQNTVGRLDVLVNNAGVYRQKHGLELTENEWFEGLDSTVNQTFFTTRALLPLLRQSENGRVINIGDSSCDRASGRDLAWSYHIGKTGVWMLTRSFAMSEACHGIAVNMLSPGVLVNSIDLADNSDMPAGRFGTFADMQTALRFLALDAPNYLTGSNLMVSGGWNLR